MRFRSRAAVAASIVVALLTGTAITQAPAQINQRFPNPHTVVVPTPRPSRDLSETYVSRDWIRSPLIVAPVPPTPLPTRDSAVATTSAKAAGQVQPDSPRVTDLPRPSVSATPSGPSVTSAGEAGLTGPRAYAHKLVKNLTQWLCLDQLWGHESGWRWWADNRTSTAYGIAQRLDETSHDPDVQIDNGIAYIRSRYGSPCAAWAFWLRKRWY